MNSKIPFARFLNISFYVYCFVFLNTSILFSSEQLTDRLKEFYGDFLCEEKEILSAVGLSSPCTCAGCGTIPYPSNTGYTTPDPITNSPQVKSVSRRGRREPQRFRRETF